MFEPATLQKSQSAAESLKTQGGGGRKQKIRFFDRANHGHQLVVIIITIIIAIYFLNVTAILQLSNPV